MAKACARKLNKSCTCCTCCGQCCAWRAGTNIGAGWEPEKTCLQEGGDQVKLKLNTIALHVEREWEGGVEKG